MTKTQKKKLLKEIASIAEKAYRRGFQHGDLMRPGQKACYEYRYRHGKWTPYTLSPEAPASDHWVKGARPAQPLNRADKAVNRLSIELGCGTTYDLIRELIHEVHPHK